MREARQSGATAASVSLNLGKTQVYVRLLSEGVELPTGNRLSWAAVDLAHQNENACYLLNEQGEPEKIQQFSEEFNRLYSLMPVVEHNANKGAKRTREAAPTMLISGIPMHRIKGTTPQRDTKEKIRAAGPIRGDVLDTSTGLGYTAIAASKQANQVTTIELDPAVLDICRQNPWSQALFTSPNIEQHIGDAFDVVETLDDESFDIVIHDPPMFNMAGHLYSGEFYQELFRILRPRGKLFHYIGNPDSKSGRNVTKGVSERIQHTGFSRIRPQPRAFGLTAQK